MTLSRTPRVVGLRSRVATMALLSISVISAHAQTANPATLQSQEQRIQRYYEERREKAPMPVADPVQDAAPASASTDVEASIRFVLREVRFAESAFLDPATLQATVKPYLGLEVGIAQLDAILAAVNQAYADKGISTARAVLGTQAVRNGVVQVDLIEGRLGDLTVQGNAHTGEAFVRTRISQRQDEVVDTAALRRDLVYFNRTTDLQAQALLRPGTERGRTDILVQLTEPARRYADVFIDNAGVDSTGRERIGVQARLNGLIGGSDRLAASFAYAEGGLEGQASYSWLVSPRNARLGVSYSRSQINIINGAFRDLDIEGDSSVVGLDFAQPFVATQHWMLNGLASVSRSRSQTSVAGERIADTRSTVYSVGADLSHQGEGREWSLTQLVSSISADVPVVGRDRFTIAAGSLAYLQRFGQSRWGLRANVGWQYSGGDALTASNLFQIGGLGSVRGYERGVLSGPRGYFVDLELHRAFGERWDTYAFVDHGAIKGEFPRSADITGVGLGGSWRRDWLAVSLDLGHALDKVLADQNDTRIDFRVTARWQ